MKVWIGNKCVLIFMKILVTKAVSEDPQILETCHLKIILPTACIFLNVDRYYIYLIIFSFVPLISSTVFRLFLCWYLPSYFYSLSLYSRIYCLSLSLYLVMKGANPYSPGEVRGKKLFNFFNLSLVLEILELLPARHFEDYLMWKRKLKPSSFPLFPLTSGIPRNPSLSSQRSWSFIISLFYG